MSLMIAEFVELLLHLKTKNNNCTGSSENNIIHFWDTGTKAST